MKVLLSAFQCQPETNSEASVGWYWALNLSRDHEVTVITRPWASAPDKTPVHLPRSLRFEFCPLPRWCEVFNKPDHRNNIYYALWQWLAYRHARRLLRRERFDLAHHVVYCSTTQPTFMPLLPLPFIFGPIGESDRVPFRIARHYGWRVVLREYSYWCIKHVLRNYSPISRYAYRRAAHVLVASNSVLLRLPARVRSKTTAHPGFAGFSDAPVIRRNQERPFRACFVGRFVYVKAPDLALRAFLAFAADKPDVHLTMVGRGPLSPGLHRIRNQHTAGRSVDILDWTTRANILKLMQASDVFLFPTFEGGGTVILEAMSLGMPIIALDFGGAATYLPPNSGLCIPVGTIDQIVDRLALSLDTLYQDESRRIQIGRAALATYADRYSWTAKLALIEGIYARACNHPGKQVRSAPAA
ncbi:MAG: glycosyltransferase family 4 protein [Terracidiphilus sp.]|jgi:glycosyltransferase involved in cell wall biosynthesis